MQNKTAFKLSTLSAAVASALVTTPVSAQNTNLEEVIVTATRRAQSVQDIPINITALSSEMIERQRLTDAVYVAVPLQTGRSFAAAFKKNIALCRRLGIGLITVRPRSSDDFLSAERLSET